jgi:hypothetical protein
MQKQGLAPARTHHQHDIVSARLTGVLRLQHWFDHLRCTHGRHALMNVMMDVCVYDSQHVHAYVRESVNT